MQTLLKPVHSGTEKVALRFRENAAGVQALADASAALEKTGSAEGIRRGKRWRPRRSKPCAQLAPSPASAPGNWQQRWRQAATASCPLDLNTTIVITHSDKQHAAPTWKHTFDFHPMTVFADHGPGGSGEPLAIAEPDLTTMTFTQS